MLALNTTRFSFLKPAVALIAAAGLFVAHSEAAIETLEYTETKTLSLTDWGHSFELQQFNSSLGDLLSVEFVLTLSGTTNLSVTNNGDSATNGNASTRITLSISPSDLFPVNIGAVPEDGDRPYNDPYITVTSAARTFSDLAAKETRNLAARSFEGNGGATYTDAETLGAFTGNDKVNLTLGTYTETVVSVGGGNVAAVQSTNATATVTVKYTYQAVPEPATWAAMAMGAGVLIASSRFRRRA